MLTVDGQCDVTHALDVTAHAQNLDLPLTTLAASPVR